MKILYAGHTKHYTGMIEITIAIIEQGKRKWYSYTVRTENILNKFINLYMTKKYGQALNLLKKENVDIYINEKEVRQNEEIRSATRNN